MKKIVINALQYKPNSSGIGVMIRELFGEFAQLPQDECQIILSKDSPTIPLSTHTRITRSRWRYDQGFCRILYQSIFMGIKHCNNAVLLTIDSKTPFLLPRTCELMPIITDLALFRMGDVYNKSRVWLWKLQFKYILQKAERYGAISSFTKSEMIDILHIPPERIHIIPCACSSSYCRVDDIDKIREFRKKYKLTLPYILFVGNQNPRKNLERVICAFDYLKKQRKIQHQLVIIGELGWKFDSTLAMKNIQHTEDIRFIGFVPDEEMSTAYSCAEMFVFPTLYEGFGVPVLEAQNCGTPVLTSNCTALPEVGGSGAVYVDPYSEKEIADGIDKILRDESLRESLIAEGYKNAKRFSWKQSAEILSKVITNLEED